MSYHVFLRSRLAAISRYTHKTHASSIRFSLICNDLSGKLLSSKSSVISLNTPQLCSRFHTSPRRNVPPILLAMLQPIAKVTSILTGRFLRRWWRAMPEEQKANWRIRFAEKRLLLFGGASLLVLGGVVHYVTHIKETPVTKRRRYLAFTDSQMKELAEFEYKTQMENVKEKVVSPQHPVYKKVSRIVQKIVDSNQEFDYMREQAWTIVVVDSDEMNAFVIPTGHIFVFTGLLKMVENESQLAVVLGHEIAHGLLSHAAEQVSFATILDVFIIVAMAAIWAFMPTDGIAIVTQWFYNKVMQIMLHLPYNRKLEEEADYVGLLMIAKVGFRLCLIGSSNHPMTCFDVRESSTFWNKMSLQNQLLDSNNDVIELPEWLSTHPNHEKRAQTLDKLMPVALDVRTSCDCPRLPHIDPRTGVHRLRQLIAEKAALKEDNEKTSLIPALRHTVTSVPIAKGA